VAVADFTMGKFVYPLNLTHIFMIGILFNMF
jgi:hypothetical protein